MYLTLFLLLILVIIIYIWYCSLQNTVKNDSDAIDLDKVGRISIDGSITTHKDIHVHCGEYIDDPETRSACPKMARQYTTSRNSLMDVNGNCIQQPSGIYEKEIAKIYNETMGLDTSYHSDQDHNYDYVNSTYSYRPSSVYFV
jgi:hypothetical protein